MNNSSNIDDKLERVLRDEDAPDARRLRELWEMVGAYHLDRVGAPSDAVLVDRVRKNLDRFVEAEHVAGEAVGVGRKERPAPPRLPLEHSTRVRRLLRTKPSTFLAAAAVVVVGLATWWWINPIVRSTSTGETLAVTLADGSKVKLNSESRVAYPRWLGIAGERWVELQGEAFFDVANDVRPFVVQTFNAEVRVLGTRFNVRARRDEPEVGTLVALESGIIAIHPGSPSHPATVMSPGEIRRVSSSGNTVAVDSVSAASVADATAWIRGDFVLKDQPLSLILRDVMRRFDVELRADEALDDGRRWNIAIRQPESAESVVRDVAAIAGLRYRRSSNGFELFRGDGN